MKPLAPNTLLQNRYLIVHLIGKGGMGEVYLAVDQRLGSAVALKRTFFSDDEMLGTAFEREARTLARLRHPVLPKVSDHFTENDLQYLVMEHINGDDLSKRLEITNKPFPLNWVLFWADQLLDALAYLHGHEPPIVHRDIKPQNLKLTDENHIVLLDFGLAKNSVGNTHVSSTTGGSIVGYTPHYAPMEQIRGTGTNPRSDIYSLSATFYHLLTNVVPPDALTRADSVLNSLPDPAKPLNEINPEIPPVISSVILKGMALSMEQRYANAREMQKALREAYTEMQSVMSAQTMAFNQPSAQNQSLPQAQQQTNVASQFSAQNPQPPASTGFDSFAGANSAGADSLSQPDSFSSRAPNFDATMKYDSAPFGGKTEVIPMEKLPRAEDYGAKGNSNTSGGFSSDRQEDFNPDATIAPLVTFGKENGAQQTTANFNSQPKAQENYVVENTAPAMQNTEQQTGAYSQMPVHTESKKKSGGKVLAVAGGIGGLGIVVLGAGAMAWYALKPAESMVNPTPTPQAELTVKPTAEPAFAPTVEPTVESAAANTADSPAETVSSTPESTTDSTKIQDRTVSTDKPVQPTPVKVVPTPRVVTAKTPPAVVKTPAPAKTPAKAKPTDILQ